MNCVIIEDEFPAIERLEFQLNEIRQDINIVARLGSVKKAVEWFSDKSNAADIIFSDIQLEDGLSFEIFDHVQIRTPVIFTTSYNEYAIKAFGQNSISYLLKPIKSNLLKNALDKYSALYDRQDEIAVVNEPLSKLNTNYQQRFLVRSGNKLLSLEADNISYFYIQNRFLFLVAKNKQQYLYDSTMEILEQRIDPARFFRINRSFIVHFDAIKSIQILDRGRLQIETDPETREDVTVSVHKTVLFKRWLDR